MTGKRLRGPIGLEETLSANLDKDQRPDKVYRHSRPKFHAMLIEQLNEIGLAVEYGKEVADYSDHAESGQASVTLKDGSIHAADLVIAAEGVGGNSNSIVNGRPVPARRTGDAIFRAAYPVELAMADPVVADRFQLTEEGHSVVELWAGHGANAVFWRSQDQMSIGIQHPDHGTAEESWSHTITHDDILAYTSTIPGWPEVASRAIRTIPSDLLMDYKLVWRDPQPQWTSPGGRVVQLGDAAHTLLPTSGNGATQAIEDALSLATCLSIAGGKDKIPEATRVHNLLRFERVSCMQAFGVSNRKKQKADLKSNTKGKGKGAHMSIPKWITHHDPEVYALERYDAALAHLESGAEFHNTNIPPGIEYRPWTIDTMLDARERGEPTVLDGDWD